MLSSETLIKQFHNMTFVLKPQAPFDRLRLANSCPEVALNKAIILQAIIDASNISKSRSSQQLAHKASKWLFGKSEGLIEACMNAELDHKRLLKIVQEIINLHSKEQNKEPCKDRNKAKNNLLNPLITSKMENTCCETRS